MKITCENYTTVPSSHSVVPLRCPHCRQNGVLVPLIDRDVRVDQSSGNKLVRFHFCLRRCPDQNCLGQIFVVKNEAGVVGSFPATTIEFNLENVPEDVKKTFEEAIICHANSCFTASAIMIRRTLEEICGHQKADGKDLKARLEALRSTIMIPKAFMEAAQELRLLGNDAAHLENKLYSEIGHQEVQIALSVTTEIIKAVYQMDGLIKRLNSLKRPQ